MRRLALFGLAALLLSAAACGSDSGEGGPEPSDCVDLSTRGESFTIRLVGNEFVPSCFTASAAQRLELVNEDGVLHSFTIEGTPIDVDIEGRETLDLDPVTGSVEPGTYELICKYHLPGMRGTITIAPP
jgi:plastocyanin